MELHFNSGLSINDVQRQFAEYFPFLRLQFFDAPKIPGTPDRRLEEFSRYLEKSTVYFSPDITVTGLLDKIFLLGLIARVFRKSGNHWVEITLTNDWSLERQSKEAMLVSQGL